MNRFKKLKDKLLENAYIVLSNIEDRIETALFDEAPYDAEDDNGDDNETYVITPKGIVSLCMVQCGLTDDINDPRIDGFFSMFESSMRTCGYIYEGDNDNDC